jgi:hypothetical protein
VGLPAGTPAASLATALTEMPLPAVGACAHVVLVGCSSRSSWGAQAARRRARGGTRPLSGNWVREGSRPGAAHAGALVRPECQIRAAPP